MICSSQHYNSGKHAVYYATYEISYEEFHRVVKMHGDELDAPFN
jgi:hypothetical protein